MSRTIEISSTDDHIDVRDVTERFEQLEALRKPWAAGCNMPGYMPDSEPCGFEEWSDARDAIVKDLEEAIELAYGDSEALAGDDATLVANLEDAIKRLNDANEEAEYGETIGNWHYWIAPVDGKDAFEDADEGAEYALLQELLSDLEGNGGDHDWRGSWYPIGLIRDSYFVTAMQELCNDIGDVSKDLPSYIEIDWEATARNLRVDYSSVEFEGVTYWYR
jgi:hypothetical protein